MPLWEGVVSHSLPPLKYTLCLIAHPEKQHRPDTRPGHRDGAGAMGRLSGQNEHSREAPAEGTTWCCAFELDGHNFSDWVLCAATLEANH